ncbi:BTB/POZ and MATH domain-containing protein 2-like [Lolium perenne]|uniref:BTB/POZ and MATH domain-containing protein 2-like n=1 Tax=Lolium perenne TaxID=4522 RepID=UPI0021F5539B|nr:BTB/POZ and MATH domain-containing protein 2-like [Lolium perenne]
MSKRAKMTEPEARTTIVSSCVQFRIDYEQTKQFPIGKAVHSDVFSAGGHLWVIDFFPHGDREADKGEYISIFLVHATKSRSARANFEVSMMGRDGKPSDIRRTCKTFGISEDDDDSWGWYQFMKLSDVEKRFLKEGHITFACTIMVMDGSAIPVLVPPSDIGIHLGRLLDNTDGTDVSFTVDGEKFPAHRVVLAARSPVFRAELFGSMAEATMSSITLHDITPATFKAMLRFIYTDELPAEAEPEDSSVEMFQNLLAAADRYALDRLKFICAENLRAKVSADTVATILASAETHNCHELKKKCIDFFAVEENFKEAMFTDGYALLVLKFPSITAELKKRVKA